MMMRSTPSRLPRLFVVAVATIFLTIGVGIRAEDPPAPAAHADEAHPAPPAALDAHNDAPGHKVGDEHHSPATPEGHHASTDPHAEDHRFPHRHAHGHELHHIPSFTDVAGHAAHHAAEHYDFLHQAEEDLHKAQAAEIAGKAAGDDAAVTQALADIKLYTDEVEYRKSVWYSHSFLERMAVLSDKNGYGVVAFLVTLILSSLAIIMYRHRAVFPKAGWGTAGDMVVSTFYGIFEPILGKDTKRYLPFLGTMFLFIWLNNLASLVPGLKSPSANFLSNLGLSLSVFFYVQYIAITRTGLWPYIYHLMGEPKDAVTYALGIVLILPLEILGELVKPISLALRLFGNVLGEDILIFVVAGMGLNLVLSIPGLDYMPVGLPAHLLIVPLVLLGSTIQALVFSFLASVYISMKLPHDHHDHDHGHDDEHHGHDHDDEADDHHAHAHAH